MDGSEFDRLTQRWSTRRTALGGLALGGLAGLLGNTWQDVLAKKKGKKKKKKNKKRKKKAQGQTCSFGCTSSACNQAAAGCPILPANNYWNRKIDALPVDPNSNAYVASIGAGTGLHPDFGAGLIGGEPFGIPFVRVPSGQGGVAVNFTTAAAESDPGPYPIPADAPVENGSCSSGDRHVVVMQEGSCMLYELFDARQQSDGSWQAYGGAKFDLKSNALRPQGWTSADAGGFPILPGLVRFEEVAAGAINHALRFTVSRTRTSYVWPATHHAGSTGAADAPPMGQRFRLKASVDISGFSSSNRVILQALKTYGMVLADNGSDWFLSGTPDERWSNDDLREIQNRIHGSDFEAIDCSSLIVDPNSGQAA